MAVTGVDQSRRPDNHADKSCHIAVRQIAWKRWRVRPGQSSFVIPNLGANRAWCTGNAAVWNSIRVK